MVKRFRQLAAVKEIQSTGQSLPTTGNTTTILQKIHLPSVDEFGYIYSLFNQFASTLHEDVNNILIRQKSLSTFFDSLVGEFKEVSNVSQDIASTIGQVTDSSQRQADYLENMTTKVEEMKASFTRLFEEISRLGDEFSKITRQIQIVSLNASIEAARAGEHGRGFAVVAQTIRNLNSEAQNLYTTLREEVEQSLRQFDLELEQMVQTTKEIGSIGEENAASAEEVSASIEEQTATLQNIYDHALETKELIKEINELLAKYKEIGEF